ncbi:hypothetical protein ACTFIU_009031 [Dictyostelium citrinum]
MTSTARQKSLKFTIAGSYLFNPGTAFNGVAPLQCSSKKEQEVNLPVGGRLFHFKQVWKELGLPSFCQEVVSGLKVYVLRNFKSMHNPISISIPEGPKSECITKEVQELLVDDAIKQVLPNQYSKLVFYSNVFTVPKPGTNLLENQHYVGTSTTAS